MTAAATSVLLAPAPPVCAAALSHARAQCTRHAPLLAPPSNCAHPTRIAGGCYVRVPPAVPPDGSYHRQLLPERARRVQPLLLVLRGQAQVRRLCAGQQHHVLPYARQPVQPVLHHLKGWPRFDLLSHRSTQADTPHTVASAKAAVRRRSPLAGTRIVRASSSASSPPHLAPPKAVNTRPLLLRCFEGANGGRPPPPPSLITLPTSARPGAAHTARCQPSALVEPIPTTGGAPPGCARLLKARSHIF